MTLSPHIAAQVADAMPPTPVPNGQDEVPNFTRSRKPIRFQIDPDLFEAAPVLPGETLMQLMALADKADAEIKKIEVDPSSLADVAAESRTAMDIIRQMASMVLRGPTAARFGERLSDLENPIALDEAMQAIQYVMSRYTSGLPTPPSDGSAPGPASPDGGTSSMGAPLLPESTSSPSPPTGS